MESAELRCLQFIVLYTTFTELQWCTHVMPQLSDKQGMLLDPFTIYGLSIL